MWYWKYFICLLPNDIWYGKYFICLSVICRSSLMRCCSSLWSIFPSYCSFSYCFKRGFFFFWHIWNISPLLDISVAFFFLPIYGLSSHSMRLSFVGQRFLILMKSHLSMISFMDHVCGVTSKKSLPYSRSPRFSFV